VKMEGERKGGTRANTSPPFFFGSHAGCALLVSGVRCSFDCWQKEKKNNFTEVGILKKETKAH